jgi:hypothetical protein
VERQSRPRVDADAKATTLVHGGASVLATRNPVLVFSVVKLPR